MSKQERERQREQRAEARRLEEEAARRRTLLRRTGAGAGGVAVVAAIAIGIATAGGTSPGTAQPPSGAVSPVKAGDSRGLPAPIAANLRESNQVIDGSVHDRLGSLKGLPVVVNQWASWCPNCRAEFPFFQHLSQRYRKNVAFLGLDSQDSKGDAQTFLKQYPVPYPSVYDQDASQAQSLGGGQGWPTTIFIDRTGKIVYSKQGGYVTEAQLDADIRQYLLGS